MTVEQTTELLGLECQKSSQPASLGEALYELIQIFSEIDLEEEGE